MKGAWSVIGVVDPETFATVMSSKGVDASHWTGASSTLFPRTLRLTFDILHFSSYTDNRASQ
jgi:hypothetical protein